MRRAPRRTVPRRPRRERQGTRRAAPRRRWWLLVLLVLLLLLLLRLCSCEPPDPPVPEPEPAGSPSAAAAPAPEPPPTPPPLAPAGEIAPRPRPAYEAEVPPPLPWIASFRMQVAARSPRLAACFVGAARPGRLRWTASVEPEHGRVSDHTLEPTLLGDELTHDQRVCVLGVLSDPPYRLDAEAERSTPSRVGMVIEF